MKRILTAILTISLTGVFLFSGALKLPVSAREKTEEEFLADFQDAIYCMYIRDGSLSEEDVEWENRRVDYSGILAEDKDFMIILDEMLSGYEKTEFADERLTLLKNLFFSGLRQMMLAENSSEDYAFYITQYTAGLMSYQIAMNAFSDEYGIAITESDYSSGTRLQNTIIDFWESYLSEGVKEIELDGLTILVPDYYVNITDDEETNLLYANGEDIAFVGFELNSITGDDFDEMKELLSQSDEDELTEEFALGDDGAVTDISTLIDDENTVVLRLEAEEDTEVFDGIDVHNYVGYVIVDRSSGKAVIEYLVYKGDEQLVEDFDNAVLMTFGGQDGEADPDQTGQEDKKQESRAGAENTDEVSPELKEFLDAYEEVMDEYIDFMTNFDENDTGALLEYLAVMGKYVEFAEKAEEFESQDMSPADTAYYLEVTGRILKKMQSVGQ